MGNPVAFDASADDRETRGFISTTTRRPVDGSTANWTLDPPVATPTSSRQAMASRPHLLVLPIGEGHHRRHGDRVTGVDPHRVEILDRAHHDGVAHRVPHHLQLELLPAGDRLLDQHLADRRGVETCGGDPAQLLRPGGETGSPAAEDVVGPHHHRIARAPRRRPAAARHGCHRAARAVAMPAPSISALNRPRSSAEAMASRPAPISSTPPAVEHPGPGQLGGDVQRGLAAERGEQGVGLLLGDDGGDDLGGDRLDIGGVGQVRDRS